MARNHQIAKLPDHEILRVVSHRPWPLPDRPWTMVQHWHDLLFAHWALPAQQIRPLIPRELELDTFQGKAWIGVIPFWMSHVRFRTTPPIPTASKFPELNVRTYVRTPLESGKPGVYFFSLDAGSLLAVLGARTGFGLPYFWADMNVKNSGAEIDYRSTRRSRRDPAAFRASYRPTGPVSPDKSDLERFVTERYCLYAVRNGKVYRVQIHHLPWPLQPADAKFERNTMAQVHGIDLPHEKPVLQFAKSLEVYIFPAEKIR